MKRINFIMIIFTVLLTLDSCSRKIHPVASIQSSEIGRTVITKRDTTVKVQFEGDTLQNVLPLNNLGRFINKNNLPGEKRESSGFNEISELRTPYSSSQAWVSNGKLIHRHYQKDTTINVKVKDALVQEKSIFTKKESETKIERVNYLTGWQWFQVWFGKVIIGLLVLVITYLLMRRIVKR